MHGHRLRDRAGLPALVAPMLAVGAGWLLTGAVVQGPAALRPGLVPIGVGEVALLAMAAIATTFGLPRVDADWHADGPVCAALLACVVAGLAVGWEAGPVPIRVAGFVVAPLAVPALFALVERRVRGGRGLTLLSVGVVLALSIGVQLTWDPFQEPGCWADCSLTGAAPFPWAAAAQALAVALVSAGLVIALTAGALAARFVLRAPRPRASSVSLTRVIASCAAVAALLTAAVPAISDRAAAVTVAAGASAIRLLLAAAICAQPVLALRRRARLRRLAVELGDLPPVGSLESTLARTLGDRDLRVAYWLPESRRYVDTLGEPVEAGPGWGPTLMRQGRPLAVLHLGDRRDARDVMEQMGSAARLAIDNERLQAELSAQLAELRESRQRIVLAADEGRRQVERDLHDFVQAELLGAIYQLAGERAESRPDKPRPMTSDELTLLSDRLRGLSGRLREFAHGVYPAVLDASGLGAALDALSYDAPVVMSLNYAIAGRLPPAAERAAYLVVQHEVMSAEGDVAVAVAAVDQLVVVTIAGGRALVGDDLVDRVGALGGTIRSGAGRVRVELPCG